MNNKNDKKQAFSGLAHLCDVNGSPIGLNDLMAGKAGAAVLHTSILMGNAAEASASGQATGTKAKDQYPEELAMGYNECMRSGKMQSAKENDYTLYAALMYFKWGDAATLEMNRVEPDRFKKYMAEMKRLRVEELMKKTVQELYHNGEMEELKKLDESAFQKKKKQLKKD